MSRNNSNDGSIWEDYQTNGGQNDREASYTGSTAMDADTDDLEERILAQTEYEQAHLPEGNTPDDAQFSPEAGQGNIAYGRSYDQADVYAGMNGQREAGNHGGTEAYPQRNRQSESSSARREQTTSTDQRSRQAAGRNTQQPQTGRQAAGRSRTEGRRVGADPATAEAERLAEERERLNRERKLLEQERRKNEKAAKKAAKARRRYEKEARKSQDARQAGQRQDETSRQGRQRQEEPAVFTREARRRRGSSAQNAEPLYDPYTGKKVKPHKKRHPVRRFFLFVLVILILILALWLGIQIHTMQSMGMNSEEIENSIADSVKESVSSGGAQGNYKNIAVLGVDSVDNSLDSGNNRSDVMIIASINNQTGAIKLMSVYRDTYLDIGDGNYQKANAAYAFGGPDQTVQMLNRNLDLDITDYGVVGFEGIARLIDAVGGVDIDVQEDEIVHLNNYQLTMSEETGLTNIPVTQAGLQTLNGLQATAYCRIRYTNGNDFRRTERQRTVLTKTFEKIKSDPLRLVMNLNSILPYVKTSLSVPEMFSLGVKAMRFNVESQEGFPNQDLLTVGYINQQSCVIPITLAKNVTWLHSELFGETDYQPSQTVQDISAYISGVTGYY